MKKAEAISILATSVRPREAKDRARYDEAVKMAIEALKCLETPKSSERTSETAQADHIADTGKKVCVDTISRQAALDAIMGQPPEPHYPSWYAAQIEKLPAAQPDHVADIGKKISISCSQENDLISRREALNAITDELMPSTPLSAVIRAKNRLKELPSVQPDHTADIGKKVSISCGRENDLISRQAALKKLAVYIHLIDKTMGKGILTDDDCMEAAKSVLGEDELPAVQPVNMVDAHAKNTPNSTSLGEKEGKPDLISRQTALDALARMMPRSYTPDGSHPADEEIYKAQEIYVDCIESIEILPAVQPEIIRCKDCNWWTKQKDSLQGRCELMRMYPTGGWYCGNARRRGGDSD